MLNWLWLEFQLGLADATEPVSVEAAPPDQGSALFTAPLRFTYFCSDLSVKKW